MPTVVNPTDADYRELWRVNPLAAEQLKTIVLARENDELKARLAASQNGEGADHGNTGTG